jgi:hypothetical protein
MIELSVSECNEVAGGVVPLVAAGLIGIATLLGNSGAVYDFLSGVFDGFGGIQ